MSITNHTELLRALLAATRPSDVTTILESLGDRPELVVGQPLGSGPYQWHYYGNRELNISSINLAAKPGRSITERVTNAIDAVFEKRKARSTTPEPVSPMDAAKQWFGRPPTTADNGLYKWKEFSVYDYDELVRVVLTSTAKDDEPNVDVIDDGIGILPTNFASTILSLQEGNKMNKRYLAGAYGQGGSSTLAFCRYALIVSRSIDAPETVGFSVVKLMHLGEAYKEDAYVYLAVLGDDGKLTVPSVAMEGPLDLYPTVGANKPRALETGTLVRHLGYRLEGLEKTLSASPGNLYHLFHHLLFDPLLPFRLIDLRRANAPKNELVAGSRNRLMKLTEAEEADDTSDDAEESGTTLRHYSPREMVSPRADEDPSVGVEYWVALNRKRSGEKVKLRPCSHELYVQRNHPIVGTVNGQNQGEMTAKILRDLQLPMVAKHLVLHLDVSQASRDVRRNLFTSTREMFKEGEVLTELTRVITNMLREDAVLYEIERELADEMLKRESAEVNSEVRREITNLLRNAGFEVSQPGETLVPSPTGDTTTVAGPRTGRRPIHRPDPLPTIDYPDVTRFEIVYPTDGLRVHKQDNHIVRIETDANFRFDRENRIAIRSEPAKLEIASKGMLQGGRIAFRLRPTEASLPGETGQVIATITRPDGTQLSSSIAFEVLAPREEAAKKEKGLVPAFDIRPVDPFQDPDTFEGVWEDIADDEAKRRIAYKAVPAGGSLTIYYSTAFGPYAEQLEKLKRQPNLAVLFSHNYEVWIGYHAIIQQQQRAAITDVDEEQLDRILERERAVVAEMQVKQALRLAEMQSQAKQGPSE